MITNIHHFFINKLYHTNQVTFSAYRVTEIASVFEAATLKSYYEEILYLDQRTVTWIGNLTTRLATMVQLLQKVCFPRFS